MSILGSNSARFQITSSYLSNHGYFLSEHKEWMIRGDNNANGRRHKHEHIIIISRTPDKESLYISLGSKKGNQYIIPINDIPTLKLLESFWDAKGENNKKKIKAKLIKTPGTEVREWKRKEWWFDPA